MIGKEDLILLNIDDRCKGTCYTWQRGEQKSARDLAKVNNKGYEKFGKMDEIREKYNLPYRCMVKINLEVGNNTQKKKGEEEIKEKHRSSLARLNEQTYKRIEGENNRTRRYRYNSNK